MHKYIDIELQNITKRQTMLVLADGSVKAGVTTRARTALLARACHCVCRGFLSRAEEALRDDPNNASGGEFVLQKDTPLA